MEDIGVILPMAVLFVILVLFGAFDKERLHGGIDVKLTHGTAKDGSNQE